MKTCFLATLVGLAMPAARADIITLPHPGEKFPATSTAVWSPLFQAAWDKLNENLGGPLVRVEPPNRLMSNLDSFRWEPRQVLPEGSWKTWCGPATQAFLEQVNQEATAITREPKGPFFLKNGPSGSLAFFGVLDRKVEFQQQFYRSRTTPMHFVAPNGDHPVRFFGVRGEASDAFRDFVRVLAWRPLDGSHAIQIRCKEADDTAILYLPPGEQDFATACRWIRTWQTRDESAAVSESAWNDHSLHSNDEVQIPYVSLESKAEFSSQLGGIRFHGKEKPPFIITHAEQITRFQLHEKGASVRVEASGSAEPFSEPAPTLIPRKFLYNRPFFVFLWRDKAEWPYFGAWIGDASALKPFKAD